MSDDKQQQGKVEEEEIRPQQGSYLFEGIMLWVLPGLLGLAIWFRLVPLIILGTCLLVTTLLVLYWKKKALQQLKASLALSTNRIFTGNHFQLQASVANAKWLPLVWLEWEQPKQRGIVWGNQHQGPYLIRLLWLLWYQQLEWEVEGKAEQRGFYELGRVILRSGDAFRFSEEEKQHRLNAPLYVYPKLLPVSVPNLRATLSWEMRGRNGGFLEDPLLVSGLREYQSGDEWRRIDWRASSKTGVLQTSIYEKILTRHIQFIIDVQGFHQLDQQQQGEQASGQLHGPQDGQQVQQNNQQLHEQFEWFLSVIASAAVQYHEQKVWLGLSNNALDQRGKKIEAVPPSSNLLPCLDQLAKLSFSPAYGSKRLLEELLIRQVKYMPIYLFCESISEAHLRFWEKHSQQFPYLTFYFVHESEHRVKMGGAARKLESLLAAANRKGAS